MSSVMVRKFALLFCKHFEVISKWGRRLWVGLAALIVVSTAVMIIRSHLPILMWDSWADLTAQSHIKHLFYPSTNHMVTFDRLFFIADKYLAAGSENLELTVIFIVLLLESALLSWAANRAKLGLILTVLPFFCLFWAYPVSIFLTAFNLMVVVVFATAIATIAALVFLKKSGTAWGILSGFAATFSWANGVIVGLFLGPVAWFAGRSRRSTVILTAAGVLMIACYVAAITRFPVHHFSCDIAYGTKVESAGFSSHFSLIYAMLAYTGGLVGAPVGRMLFHSADVSALSLSATVGIGLIGLGLLVGLLVQAVRLNNLREMPVSVFLLGSAAYVGASVFAMGVGRAPYCALMTSTTGRYGEAAVLFWMLLIMAAGSVKFTSRSWTAKLPVIAALLLSVATIGSQLVIVRAVIASPGMSPADATTRTEQSLIAGHQADRVGAYTAVLSDVNDIAALRFVSLENDILSKIAILRQEKLAPFTHEWTLWLYKPLRDVGAKATGSCPGSVVDVKALPNGGWRVAGILPDGAAPTAILLVSSAGRVVGYGMRSPGRTLGEALLNRSKFWQGHVTPSGIGPVNAYAYSENARAICFMGAIALPGGAKSTPGDVAPALTKGR